MKIYKIYQQVNNDYDTYDSAIVCAESEEEARIINPGGFYKFHDGQWYFQYADGKENVDNDNSWAHPKDVHVEYLGEAREDLKIGIISKSFNAG